VRVRDLTFVIPVRIDTEDRLRNLSTVLRYTGRFFPASEVVVVENDAEPRTEEVCVEDDHVRRLFLPTEGRFSKSVTANAGILAAGRPFVAIYDADVLLDRHAIDRALQLLRMRVIRAVLPFNGIFADVRGELARRLSEQLEVGALGRITSVARAPYLPDLDVRVVKGGMVVADREVLRLEGGLNRRMVSYGWEDVELVRRLNRLGYRVFSLRRFSCVHLDHARGPDSVGNEHYVSNEAEFRKVATMPRPALRRYVGTELDIAGLGAARERDTLRRRQARVNLATLQGIVHPVHELSVGIRVYGIRRAGSLIRERALRK